MLVPGEDPAVIKTTLVASTSALFCEHWSKCLWWSLEVIAPCCHHHFFAGGYHLGGRSKCKQHLGWFSVQGCNAKQRRCADMLSSTVYHPSEM